MAQTSNTNANPALTTSPTAWGESLNTGGHTSPLTFIGPFNITITGTWTGTVTLKRSFDGGTTWVPVTSATGTAMAWTANVSTSFTEPEMGVQYRAEAALSVGPAVVRLSQ